MRWDLTDLLSGGLPSPLHIIFIFILFFQKRHYSDWAVYMVNESEYSTSMPVYPQPCKTGFGSVRPMEDLLERVNTASLFHSFNQLLEKVTVAAPKTWKQIVIRSELKWKLMIPLLAGDPVGTSSSLRTTGLKGIVWHFEIIAFLLMFSWKDWYHFHVCTLKLTERTGKMTSCGFLGWVQDNQASSYPPCFRSLC